MEKDLEQLDFLLNSSTGPSEFDGSTGPDSGVIKHNNIVIEKNPPPIKFDTDIEPVKIIMDNGQNYDVYPYKTENDVQLNLSYENMTEFDLSVVPDVTVLTIASKYLEELDLSQYTKLRMLTIKKTKLKELNVSKNKQLTNIMLFDNYNLNKLDISENTLIDSTYKCIINTNNGFSSIKSGDKKLLVKYIQEYVKENKEELNWMTILDDCYLRLIKEKKNLYKEHVTQLYPKFSAHVVDAIKNGTMNGKIGKKNTIEKYKTNLKKLFLDYIKKN